MELSKFLQEAKCKKKASFQSLDTDAESVPLSLSKAADSFCYQLCHKAKKEEILKGLQTSLNGTREEAYRGQNMLLLRKHLALFERFFNYLQDAGMVPIEYSPYVSIDWDVPDGSKKLRTKAHMVCKDSQGAYYAFIIHPGCCSRSMKGRSSLTNARTELASLICKLKLEQQYSHIAICSVYLSLKEDTERTIAPSFVVSDTANTNLHIVRYEDYYEDDTLQEEDMLALLRSAYDDMVTSGDADCSMCPYSGRCHTETLELHPDASDEEEENCSTYVLPTFTKEQQEVISHKDGAMRVCAGPGSGKTATLVGRIQHLICDEHIYGDFILVLSFANEAAKELTKRCATFLPEEQMPCISTINGLCYQILKENEDLLGKTLKVLSPTEKQRIVRNLISVFPPLRGFSYNLLGGAHGLYNTVVHRIDEYETTDRAAFFYKYQNLGTDFEQFVSAYREIVQSHDYVTFDEQITMCNELLRTHPEVLSCYENMYHYVMVDEFQDVNDAQMEFLYMLCKKRGNLVVVGDDDQGIYGFRGASSKYMIHFNDSFPDAKTVIFRENFRSTKELVSSAQSLIQNNKARIAKDIVSGSEKEGVKPMLVHGKDVKHIKCVVEQLLKEGYRYDDIAILSTKNAPLEALHSSLPYPTVLAKSYLRNDPYAEYLRCVLHLAEDAGNEDYLYRFCSLYGISNELLIKYKPHLYVDEKYPQELIEVLDALADALENIQVFHDVEVLVESMAYSFSLNSNVVEVLLDEMGKQQITSKDALMSYLDNLEEFQDETRVIVKRTGKIVLVTSHDSKGCEYPVVILLNDYKKNNEEVRRLFYVAMTRAKEKLFILQDDNSLVDFASEIPHTEWRENVG